MSQTSLFLSLFLVIGTFAALIAYVVIGKRRAARNPDRYQWQPEQDYDVVMRGETPMTPGFPTLVKRDRQGHTDRTGSAKSHKPRQQKQHP